MPKIIIVVSSYKILSAFMYTISDYCALALGVRMYILGVIELVSKCVLSMQKAIIGRSLTIIDDDCEFFTSLPNCYINVLMKTLEFFILCGLILVRLRDHRLLVTLVYAIFFILLVAKSVYLATVTRKMMSHKDKRLDFTKGKETICQERLSELGKIKVTMIM